MSRHIYIGILVLVVVLASCMARHTSGRNSTSSRAGSRREDEQRGTTRSTRNRTGWWFGRPNRQSSSSSASSKTVLDMMVESEYITQETVNNIYKESALALYEMLLANGSLTMEDLKRDGILLSLTSQDNNTESNTSGRVLAAITNEANPSRSEFSDALGALDLFGESELRRLRRHMRNRNLTAVEMMEMLTSRSRYRNRLERVLDITNIEAMSDQQILNLIMSTAEEQLARKDATPTAEVTAEQLIAAFEILELVKMEDLEQMRSYVSENVIDALQLLESAMAVRNETFTEFLSDVPSDLSNQEILEYIMTRPEVAGNVPSSSPVLFNPEDIGPADPSVNEFIEALRRMNVVDKSTLSILSMYMKSNNLKPLQVVEIAYTNNEDLVNRISQLIPSQNGGDGPMDAQELLDALMFLSQSSNSEPVVASGDSTRTGSGNSSTRGSRGRNGNRSRGGFFRRWLRQLGSRGRSSRPRSTSNRSINSLINHLVNN